MIARMLIGAVIAFVGANVVSGVPVQATAPGTAELQLYEVKAMKTRVTPINVGKQ